MPETLISPDFPYLAELSRDSPSPLNLPVLAATAAQSILRRAVCVVGLEWCVGVRQSGRRSFIRIAENRRCILELRWSNDELSKPATAESELSLGSSCELRYRRK